MEKPEWVNKENFESLSKEFLNHLRDFEKDKKDIKFFSHRIIERLCDKELMKYGIYLPCSNGFTLIFKNDLDKYPRLARDYPEIKRPAEIAEDFYYFYIRINDIFDKYKMYHEYNGFHKNIYLNSEIDEIFDTFYKEFVNIL